MYPFANVFKRPLTSQLTFAQEDSVEEKRKRSGKEEEEEDEDEATGKWQKMESERAKKRPTTVRKDKTKKKKVKEEHVHVSVFLEKIFAFLDWNDSSQKYDPLVLEENPGPHADVDLSYVNVAYCLD